MFLELGTTNVHHKTNKMTTLGVLPWQQFCCWCFLIKNWNSQFLSETKNHETMWELVCSKQDPLAHVRGYKWGYLLFFFDTESLELKELLWQHYKGVILFFCDAHLWCQVSRTLLQYFQRYFLFGILTFFSCKSYDIITDRYLKKKISILVYFQISRKYFSCHIHFKD